MHLATNLGPPQPSKNIGSPVMKALLIHHQSFVHLHPFAQRIPLALRFSSPLSASCPSPKKTSQPGGEVALLFVKAQLKEHGIGGQQLIALKLPRSFHKAKHPRKQSKRLEEPVLGFRQLGSCRLYLSID